MTVDVCPDWSEPDQSSGASRMRWSRVASANAGEVSRASRSVSDTSEEKDGEWAQAAAYAKGSRPESSGLDTASGVGDFPTH